MQACPSMSQRFEQFLSSASSDWDLSSTSWEDLERRCLVLQDGVSFRGPVIVMLGPYVGQVTLAAQIYLRNRRSIPSPALCGLFGTSCAESLWSGDNMNCLHGMTADDVAPFFQGRGISPITEQRRVYGDIGASTSAIIPIDAGPGCNKTTLSTGVCLYAAEQALTSEFQLIAWVVPSRNMRLEQLRVLRRYSADESRILSAGRSSEDEGNAWPTSDFFVALRIPFLRTTPTHLNWWPEI